MNPDKFGKGAYKDKIDLRDYQWKEIGFGVAPYDWTQSYDVETLLSVKLPVKNQNGSYSCGGQAWASYASVLEALDDKTFEERSAKYIYAQTYAPGGGTFGRDNANLFINQGVAREALLTSYDSGQPPGEAFITRGQDVTEASRIDAALDKAFSYANVDKDIDTVAQALAANKGLILGVYGTNNGTWLSPNPQPPLPGIETWAHWVYAGKIRTKDGVKQIGILNSWGTVAGEQGWQWLSEDYFPNGIFQVWTHVFSPNPPAVTFKHHFATKLEFRNTSLEVTALQTALQVDGTFPKNITPTQYYGTITCRAVLDFQLKYKLADPTYLIGLGGKFVGPLTITKLNVLFDK